MLKSNTGLLFLCLSLGVLINIGLHGIGWIARMVVPGLMLGGVLFLVILITKAVVKR